MCVHAEIEQKSETKKKTLAYIAHIERGEEVNKRNTQGVKIKQLTLDKLQVSGRHDEDHSTLFRLPPFFLRSIDDGEDVALAEGKFVGIVAGVVV